MSEFALQFSWLELTADLHRAGDDPLRWPRVYAELCRELDCPEVFGDGLSLAGQDVVKATIGVVAVQARQCASTCAGRCGHGPTADESKRRTCLAILDHLDQALSTATVPAAPPVTASLASVQAIAALEAIGRPLLMCTQDGTLVHANTAGREELKRGKWLSLDDARVFLGSGVTRMAWHCHGQSSESWHVPIVSSERQRADLWCKTMDSVGNRYLLALTRTTDSDITTDELRLSGATPRQRELAALILAGRNLSEAAREMGITRRTAIEHQRALFALSHTRRLADLVMWLQRLREM